MNFNTRIKLSLFAASMLAFSPTGWGQAVYGSIFGTVTDATGAVIPNATVVVTDEAKGTSVTAQSNGSGEFTVEHLIPDTYDIKISTAGFKAYEQKGLVLHADTSTKVTAALTTGGAEQTVEVNADQVAELKTDRADVSTVFGGQELNDLPIQGRNFTSSQLLLPGAQPLGWSHAASENPQGSQQIQVNGQAFGGVAFELDGTDNQDPILGIIVINPNIDSLSESKITTQNFDAEFGKAVASVVTAQTKSGTNKFHGSLFDYRQSSANLARDPYTQQPGQFFPPGLRSQFGGSLGGPILKDKLFFFTDYQGQRQKVGSIASSTVPTALLASTCLGKTVGPSGIAGCDFSDYLAKPGFNAYGSGIIYQQNGTGATNGQPYTGNVIPTGQLSAQGLGLIKLLAAYAPNKASAAGGPLDTYTAGGSGLLNSNQWDVRIDNQTTERIHSFGRFSRFTDILSGPTLFGNAGGPGFGLGGFGGTSNGANDSLAAGADVALTPKLVTDFRLGYYRYNIVTSKFDQTVAFANQLAIPGLNTGTNFTNGAPQFQIDMPTGNGLFGSGLGVNRCNCPLEEREDQFQIVNNWTKTLGNHSIKFGVDLRYARNLRVPSDTNRAGQLEFQSGPTSNPALAVPGGLGFATLALGEVGQFGRYVSTSTNAKEFQKRDFFYVQDTWRATQKLTLNLGLRYELYFPESVNGKGNGALMNLDTGYLSVAGYGSIPSNMGWGIAKNTYNPRIGAAYQLDEKTVIRAGYGRSFDLGVFGSIFGHVVTQNLPVLANQEVSGTGDPTSFAFNLAAGPPAPPQIAVPSDGLLPVPGYAVSAKARPTPLRLPTLDAWNLSLQRSITPTLSVTMAYVGNKGTHTLGAGDNNNTNPNEAAIVLPAKYSVVGAPLHYDPSVSSTAIYSNAFSQYPGIAPDGGTNVQKYLQRYYGGSLKACQDPAYNRPAGVAAGACGWNQGISYYGDNMDTHYNALDVTVDKQFSHGLSFTSNYAWQSSINFNSQFNTWNARAGKGRDDSTREQQLVTYGVYALPFGHNQHFLGSSSKLVDELVGGWQISPVINISSGLPFTLGFNECSASVGGTSAPCYPNGNPGALKTSLGKFDPVNHNRVYFQPVSSNILTNPADGFSAPGLDQIGNVGRNSNFGPYFFNADISLQKAFTLYESIQAQLRVDAYNAFNHINPGNPGGNIESVGVITGEAAGASPRQLQFSARIQF